MTPSMLNRPLILEERVRVPDGAGGYSETWSALGTLWAELRASSGREAEGEFVTLSRATYKITVRAAQVGYPSRPKPDQRFRDGARIFVIHAVVEAGTDGRFLVCHAQEETVT